MKNNRYVSFLKALRQTDTKCFLLRAAYFNQPLSLTNYFYLSQSNIRKIKFLQTARAFMVQRLYFNPLSEWLNPIKLRSFYILGIRSSLRNQEKTCRSNFKKLLHSKLTKRPFISLSSRCYNEGILDYLI